MFHNPYIDILLIDNRNKMTAQIKNNVEGNNVKNQKATEKAMEMILQMDNTESLYDYKMYKVKSINDRLIYGKRIKLKSEIRGMTYLRTEIEETANIKVKAGEATIINIELLDSVLVEVLNESLETERFETVKRLRDELKDIAAFYVKYGRLN
jgi:hypothetical protein